MKPYKKERKKELPKKWERSRDDWFSLGLVFIVLITLFYIKINKYMNE